MSWRKGNCNGESAAILENPILFRADNVDNDVSATATLASFAVCTRFPLPKGAAHLRRADHLGAAPVFAHRPFLLSQRFWIRRQRFNERRS